MTSRKHLAAGLLATALIGVLGAGCGSSSDGSSATGGNASSSAGSEKKQLTVKGSDTMVQLAQAWAQDFMKAHSDMDVQVTGGGSNTGIAALINKTTEIANASRPMKDEEKASAKEKGVDAKEFIVAQDALSIIVNVSNPVKDLTIAQLKDIYMGKVTNWKEVGGPDKKIIANGRESSSGTFVFFQEHVLNKEPFATAVLQSPSTNQIVDNVSQDAGGIGYVGLGYVNDKVRAVPIKKDAASPAVHGEVKTVLDNSYSLSRPLYEYTAGEPSGAAKTWIDWIMSADGQAVVEKLGFVPVKK